MKTLIVRLDHLGDLLLTTPLVRAVATAGHDVDVLVRDSLLPIFERSPHVKNSFGVQSVAPGFPENWRELGRWMRTQTYDVIILAFAKEKRLCFASAMSGAKKRIAMWGGIWGRLTLHQCLRSDILNQPRPFSDILLRCADALEIPRQGLAPDIFLSEEEQSAGRNLIPPSLANRRLIGIHPGSAGNACNLPTEIYAQLARALLQQTDCGLIVTGTEAERGLLARWPDEVLQSERLWISMGQLQLRALSAVIGEMDVYVCSSTGPLHIASAMAIPTVSPFCPTSPLCAAIWGNTGAPARVIEPATCPLKSGVRACCDFQNQISVERMFAETVAALDATSAKR